MGVQLKDGGRYIDAKELFSWNVHWKKQVTDRENVRSSIRKSAKTTSPDSRGAKKGGARSED